MNTHADKTPENKSQAVANSLSKHPSNAKSAFQFVDNRPEEIAQRRLQEAINNSPRVQQLKAYQEIATNSPTVKKLNAYQAIATNFTSQTTQRKENLEEETRQGKFEPIQKKENNTGLPNHLKSGIENFSGYSMDDVKVHYNSDKPAQLQAHAYAQGTHIHLASGQEKHLPHEAWHVVQQKQGRVKPTIQMNGKVSIHDDANLEKEADLMGPKAFTFNSNESDIALNPVNPSNYTVQRLVITTEPISEVDSVIAADMAFQQKKAGGKIIFIEEIIHAEQGEIHIEDGEGIVLTGHGKPGEVTGISAIELAGYLKKIGNYQKAKFIYISSCDAATPNDETGKSVVDVTNEVLNAIVGEDGPVPVYGATGIAINDFDLLTGDFQTRYKKEFEGVAILIEDIVTAALYPNVKEALELNSIEQVVEYGNAMLTNDKFRVFYEQLIRALSGKLTITEAIELTKGLGVEIAKKASDLQKLEEKLTQIGNTLSSTETLDLKIVQKIERELSRISGKLEIVGDFIQDAYGLIDFIEKNYLQEEHVSTISETDLGEPALHGYDTSGTKKGQAYSKI